MPDVTTAIGAAISGVKTATEIAKLLNSLNTDLKNADLKMQVANLTSALADIKIQLSEVNEEHRIKNEEIRDLKRQIDIQNQLTWEPPYYWLTIGEIKDGPFCQKCYDVDRKTVRLQDHGNGRWQCCNCDHSFRDSSYRKPSIARRSSEFPF